MAPGKNHEDAIEIIRSILKDEFSAEDSDFVVNDSGYFRGLFPDLALRMPMCGLWLVVEVGNTRAEKIEKYLSLKHISEIRWYTKLREKEGIKLVGQWYHGNNLGARVSPSSCSVRKREIDIKRELKFIESDLVEKQLFKDSYLCCSGCGTHVQLKHLKIISYRGRDYGVCQDCKKEGYFETMSSQREELYNYIYEKRMAEKARQCKQDGLNSETQQNTQQ